MSNGKSYRNVEAALQGDVADEVQWISIFAVRIREELKQVLQEDMDWATSLPILERLNRLREIEKRRLEKP